MIEKAEQEKVVLLKNSKFEMFINIWMLFVKRWNDGWWEFGRERKQKGIEFLMPVFMKTEAALDWTDAFYRTWSSNRTTVKMCSDEKKVRWFYAASLLKWDGICYLAKECAKDYVVCLMGGKHPSLSKVSLDLRIYFSLWVNILFCFLFSG